MSSIAQPVARSVSRSVLAGQRMNLGYLIRSMFSNSEQGFAYDINDLSTLFQDATGTIPVTGAGQPVGLVLDKSRGLEVGSELSSYANGFSSLTGIGSVGATLSLSNNELTITALDGTSDRAEIPISGLTVGKYYRVSFLARRPSSTGTQGFQQFTPFTKLFYKLNVVSNTFVEHVFLLEATAISGVLRAYASDTGAAGGDRLIVKAISVKEIVGNHAYQTTSSMRPLLQNSPRKIDYDGVDDKLTASLPAQLTGCTVIRAVPGVGAQILTNQTIATPYNDSTDHCGLIVINRALTQTETAQITQIFNRLAGV